MQAMPLQADAADCPRSRRLKVPGESSPLRIRNGPTDTGLQHAKHLHNPVAPPPGGDAMATQDVVVRTDHDVRHEVLALFGAFRWLSQATRAHEDCGRERLYGSEPQAQCVTRRGRLVLNVQRTYHTTVALEFAHQQSAAGWMAGAIHLR
jgi:hypothetical protein